MYYKTFNVLTLPVITHGMSVRYVSLSADMKDNVLKDVILFDLKSQTDWATARVDGQKVALGAHMRRERERLTYSNIKLFLGFTFIKYPLAKAWGLSSEQLIRLQANNGVECVATDYLILLSSSGAEVVVVVVVVLITSSFIWKVRKTGKNW